MDLVLKSYLAKHNISYKLHKHPAVFTVEQSKKEPAIQGIPGVRTKSLFLKDEKGKFYLVSMAGEKRLNIRALEKHLKVKHLQFGSPEELKSELKLAPGSVSIFSLIHTSNTRLIIDKDVWNAEIAGFHPNVNTATLVIDHENLEKFCNSLKCKKEVLELE